MAIGIIRIKIKMPDGTTDKEWNDIIKKYLDVYQNTKSMRANKYSDGWECWL